jgi:hypothetical protein
MAMWQAWKSPEDFWRSVERRLSDLEFPYLAFATRSDVPINRRHYERVRGILEHLLTDRMATRVVFTTPEDALSRLGFRMVPETA